jgi:DNA mismatch endonuclease (patch repair protein)
MADVHSEKTRSFNMSMIKAKNTKPEIMVRKFLFRHGFRFRLNVKTLPGKPDIVLPKYKTVIFVNGCFWHAHEDCKYFVVPKTRTDWWLKKIERNKLLDNENRVKLKSEGWEVINIFECELKSGKKNATLSEIVKHLKGTSIDNESPAR